MALEAVDVGFSEVGHVGGPPAESSSTPDAEDRRRAPVDVAGDLPHGAGTPSPSVEMDEDLPTPLRLKA
eukprot:6648319-Karenia_brevis.AAC.1